MAKTKIEWTDATWNPVSGCTPIAPECANCYAVPTTYRLETMGKAKYAGLTVLQSNGRRQFNGKVRCDESALAIPLKWRKPRMIFVNSMSDLFHEAVPFEFIDRVFAVMALCPHHTFQILTKRPERMAEYLNGYARPDIILRACKADHGISPHPRPNAGWSIFWPLHNVWLLASCGTQKTADEFIPHLLRCPARVRGLSVEPMLGPVNLVGGTLGEQPFIRGIHWVIVGGESGPHARPFDLAWARSIRDQCKAAGVAFFMKQLGNHATWNGCGLVANNPPRYKRDGQEFRILTNDPKGGNMAEWPEDLRVRELPEAKHGMDR